MTFLLTTSSKDTRWTPAFRNTVWKPLQDAVCWIHFRQGTRKDLSFGGQGLTPSLFTIQCRPTASKSGIPERWQNFESKGLHASARSEDNSQKCLQINAATAAAGHIEEHRETCWGAEPRHPKEHRVTCWGGGESIQSRSHNPRNPTRCSDWKSIKNVLIEEFVDKLWTEYHTESIVADLEKKGTFNSECWIVGVGRNFQDRSMPSVLKIRTWGITLWCMPCALAGTEKKDQN